VTLVVPRSTLSARDAQALARAVGRLENETLARRLAEVAGRSVDGALQTLPRPLKASVDTAVEKAILRCLDIAVKSMKPGAARAPRPRIATLLAGLSGSVGGALGIAGLPIELPLTTILMLRAIADIARHHGEDLSILDARLACVEVFALGAGSQKRRVDVGYYASRAMLARASSDAVNIFVERGITGAALPVVSQFVAEIAERFGLVVSERIAVSALPLGGAIGGAAINAVFMDYFQELAQGHFVVRRLERIYGANVIEQHYLCLAGNIARTRK
jgi:hypothetical protein